MVLSCVRLISLLHMSSTSAGSQQCTTAQVVGMVSLQICALSECDHTYQQCTKHYGKSGQKQERSRQLQHKPPAAADEILNQDPVEKG